MGEITDLMSRKIFLDVCMEIERLSADLYHYYSKMYEDIPEAYRFWKKAALDKENLRKQYEVLLRLLNEIEFDVSRDSMKQAYSIKRKLLNLMDHIKNSKPDLPTAFSKAVEIEQNLADMHDHPSLYFREESMRKLFKTLSEAERDHVDDLQRNRTIQYPRQCEWESST